MTDHDIILLATKYGSWFGNTLEIRKDNLVEMVQKIRRQAFAEGYEKGHKASQPEPTSKGEDNGRCPHGVPTRLRCESCEQEAAEPVAWANPVILLPADEGDQDEEWTVKVQSHKDETFSLPLYAHPSPQTSKAEPKS